MLLVLLFGRTIGCAIADVLVPPCLGIEAIEHRSDHFFTRGMASGDVQEFLGGSRALAPQLVNQRLVGCPKQEGSYHVGVGDVRELVALSGEAPDVPAEGFIGLLAAVLEVPWVSRAFVRALEVPHKDLHEIRPTLNGVGR